MRALAHTQTHTLSFHIHPPTLLIDQLYHCLHPEKGRIPFSSTTNHLLSRQHLQISDPAYESVE